MSDIHLPAPASVLEAAERLQGVASPTPVLTSRTLDERVGARVFLKGEQLQRTGSFKFRGAYNALSRLSEGERSKGVLTYSSGNHAQAVALAGRLLGVKVAVVMPADAPRSKLDATREYGAEVILYQRHEITRERLARRLREERGVTLIPPYDHPDVIAGQGTVGLELLDQAAPLDRLYAPCGGGGLLSGCVLAARARAPGCRVVGVEPASAADATRSLRDGVIRRLDNPDTIADGLRTPSLGRLTFGVLREAGVRMVTVSEPEIAAAMRFLWTRAKVVAEPSGAVALAGLLQEGAPGERAGVIVSGGNVELERVCELLGSTGTG
ncbi:MAG: threo-3-hydroxy-L-aspartate ammonia-lyase [Longimicrobiaceae bacterium]